MSWLLTIILCLIVLGMPIGFYLVYYFLLNEIKHTLHQRFLAHNAEMWALIYENRGDKVMAEVSRKAIPEELKKIKRGKRL